MNILFWFGWTQQQQQQQQEKLFSFSIFCCCCCCPDSWKQVFICVGKRAFNEYFFVLFCFVFSSFLVFHRILLSACLSVRGVHTYVCTFMVQFFFVFVFRWRFVFWFMFSPHKWNNKFIKQMQKHEIDNNFKWETTIKKF